LLSAQTNIRQAANKAKEKLRINALKILQFDSRDTSLIQESFHNSMAFIHGVQLNYGLTKQDILLALQKAHQASDEYYTMRHAMEWDTTFVIPSEAIVIMIFPKCVATNKICWQPIAYHGIVSIPFLVLMDNVFLE
jgi:hypothetical protein